MRQKRILVLSGLFVFLIAFILAGILYFQFRANYTQTNKTSSDDQGLSIANQTVCIPQPSQKSTGNIYKNENLGISFKPPKDWTVSVECPEEDLAEVLIEAPESGKELVGRPESIPYHYFVRRFFVNVRLGQEDATLDKVKKEILELHYPETLTDSNVDDHLALRTTGIPWGGLTDVWIVNKDKIYIISHAENIEGSAVENPRYSQQFEQLLSSFKFTD